MKAKILSALLLLSTSLTLAACQGAETSSAPSSSIDSSVVSSVTSSSEKVTLESLWTEYETHSIADIIEMCKQYTENASTERFYVKAEIVSIDDPAYGEMTIKDATGQLLVYGSYSADGEDRYDVLPEKPVAGDFVLLYGTITEFKGTPEIKSGWIIDFYTEKETPVFDPSEYEQKTIAEARAAEKDAKIRVQGTVAQFTYNASKTPNGLILADGASSIYVYDATLANQVEIGNNIDICGTKDYFVASNESSYAEKWGYKGSNQLTDVTLISNDGKTNTVDYTGYATKTVKEIVDTEASNDIAGLIYHTTAVIKKDENPGFTNYYINDFDDKTGSYVYTQANGADFAWLDQYDGKVCDVLLTALNAKSTDTGTIWRFLPISVTEHTDFAYPADDVAQFALDYYLKDQFQPTYSGDPALEMITSIQNAHMDMSQLSISYKSSNESVASFVTGEDGKTVFHMNTENGGQADITITVTNGTHKSATATIKVQTLTKPTFENVKTVSEAISAEEGTEVLVKAQVGPSLVNKVGFYLIDATGLIAVETATADEMDGLSIGDSVYVKATRGINTGSGKTYGQICLKGGEIEWNDYGDASYPEDSFITDKTLADIEALDVNDSMNTVKAYKLEDVQVTAEKNQYSANYYIKQGETSLQLYTSNAETQYPGLTEYTESEELLDMVVAPCNWNSKTPYKLCVLSWTDSEGVTYYNTLNFDK